MSWTKLTTALGIRTAADVRGFLYAAIPVLTALLVTLGVTVDQAALWAGLVAAIAGPGIAWWLSRDLSRLRAALYAVAGAGQAILIGQGLVDGADTRLAVVSAIIAALGGGLAGANTPVSSGWTRNVNGEADPHAVVVE